MISVGFLRLFVRVTCSMIAVINELSGSSSGLCSTELIWPCIRGRGSRTATINAETATEADTTLTSRLTNSIDTAAPPPMCPFDVSRSLSRVASCDQNAVTPWLVGHVDGTPQRVGSLLVHVHNNAPTHLSRLSAGDGNVDQHPEPLGELGHFYRIGDLQRSGQGLHDYEIVVVEHEAGRGLDWRRHREWDHAECVAGQFRELGEVVQLGTHRGSTYSSEAGT